MDKKEQKPYVLTYDIMNIAACIAVVILHVNGAFWGFSYDLYWRECLVSETVFYWAVPVFFMLSGATLIDYRERYTTREYLTRRSSKTLIPFLVWSLISILWAINISHYMDASEVSTWQDFCNAVINCNAMSIYWFFPPLFVLYLCFPVLGSIPKDKRKRIFSYMIVCAFLLDSFLPTALAMAGINMPSSLHFPLNGGLFVIFPLLGYFITHYPISKRWRIVIYLLGFFGWAIRFFYTLDRSLAVGYIDQTMFGYSNFPSVLLSTAVFVWFWYRDFSFLNKPRIIKVLRTISGASLGVYLVHFYILRFVIDKFGISMQSLKWRVLGVPFVYLSALVVVLLAKKVPYIRKLLP